MPSIGNIDVSLHTVGRDETVYARAGNTVSHTDVVALRRTVPSAPTQPLRTNVRFERGFATPATVSTGLEKPITVSIAITVPPGVAVADARTYVTEACIEAAVLAANIGTTGDIHL
jgi:hypothetical protein